MIESDRQRLRAVDADIHSFRARANRYQSAGREHSSSLDYRRRQYRGMHQVGAFSYRLNRRRSIFGNELPLQHRRDWNRRAARNVDVVASGRIRMPQIRIDPSVVRGLEYYTGPVFEAELTFEVKDDDGRPVRFGSVGGGGRYDGLVARFRAEPVPATGFSIGVSRLLAALRAIHSPIVAAAETPGPVVVLALDRDARLDGELSAARRQPAPGGDRGRTLSGLGRHERAAQIRRPAPEPRRRHPGLERAQRGGRSAGHDPRPQRSAPSLRNRPRTAPTTSNCASALNSPRPKRSWSSGCARFWRGVRTAAGRPRSRSVHKFTRANDSNGLAALSRATVTPKEVGVRVGGG